MNIQFTGAETKNKDLYESILDGEHILYNKKGQFINLYAAFDIYFINNQNVTGLAFIDNNKSHNQNKHVKESAKKTAKKINYKNIQKIAIDDANQSIKVNDESSSDEEEVIDDLKQDKPDKDKDEKNMSATNKKIATNFRLNILNSAIKTLKHYSLIENSSSKINITLKKFYAHNIFLGASTILNSVEKGLYEYNTDGLIFTPTNTGVASQTIGEAATNYKVTWNESFKWKPPEYNTIDFLVRFKKNDYGENIIGNIYENGINMQTHETRVNYYTLILHVGFDEKKHGYINPYNDLINDYVKVNS